MPSRGPKRRKKLDGEVTLDKDSGDRRVADREGLQGFERCLRHGPATEFDAEYPEPAHHASIELNQHDRCLHGNHAVGNQWYLLLWEVCARCAAEGVSLQSALLVEHAPLFLHGGDWISNAQHQLTRDSAHSSASSPVRQQEPCLPSAPPRSKLLRGFRGGPMTTKPYDICPQPHTAAQAAGIRN